MPHESELLLELTDKASALLANGVKLKQIKKDFLAAGHSKKLYEAVERILRKKNAIPLSKWEQLSKQISDKIGFVKTTHKDKGKVAASIIFFIICTIYFIAIFRNLEKGPFYAFSRNPLPLVFDFSTEFLYEEEFDETLVDLPIDETLTGFSPTIAPIQKPESIGEENTQSTDVNNVHLENAEILYQESITFNQPASYFSQKLNQLFDNQYQTLSISFETNDEQQITKLSADVATKNDTIFVVFDAKSDIYNKGLLIYKHLPKLENETEKNLETENFPNELSAPPAELFLDTPPELLSENLAETTTDVTVENETNTLATETQNLKAEDIVEEENTATETAELPEKNFTVLLFQPIVEKLQTVLKADFSDAKLTLSFEENEIRIIHEKNEYSQLNINYYLFEDAITKKPQIGFTLPPKFSSGVFEKEYPMKRTGPRPSGS